MSETSDRRLYFPHVARNREPILEVLRRVLPRDGLVLEVASGGGEHAACFAQNLPGVLWQPTDANTEMFESIAAHRAAAGVANLLAPLYLDVTSEQWPVERADALVCCNMIHIAPWATTEGLIAGAGRTLSRGSPLYLYGPYKIDGRHTAPSNQDFDTRLRAQNSLWACAISPTYRAWRNTMASRRPKPCRCRPTISASFFGARS
jgi:SAM-dependent methyltransferase